MSTRLNQIIKEEYAALIEKKSMKEYSAQDVAAMIKYTKPIPAPKPKPKKEAFGADYKTNPYNYSRPGPRETPKPPVKKEATVQTAMPTNLGVDTTPTAPSPSSQTAGGAVGTRPAIKIGEAPQSSRLKPKMNDGRQSPPKAHVGTANSETSRQARNNANSIHDNVQSPLTESFKNVVKNEFRQMLKEAEEKAPNIQSKLETLRKKLVKEGQITSREKGSGRNNQAALPERRIPLATVSELIEIPVNELILHFLNGERITEGEDDQTRGCRYGMGMVYFYDKSWEGE